jgi:hypothetical protein
VEISGKTYEFDKDSWPSYGSAGEDDIKRMWLDEVGSATWLAEMLIGMRWAILLSEEPVSITTDNPVVMLHPSLQFRGMKNAETSVVFSLSPTRLLHIDNRMSEPDGQYYPLRGSAGSLNGLLWRHAINAMYSTRHTDHVCAEICADADQWSFTRAPDDDELRNVQRQGTTMSAPDVALAGPQAVAKPKIIYLDQNKWNDLA